MAKSFKKYASQNSVIYPLGFFHIWRNLWKEWLSKDPNSIIAMLFNIFNFFFKAEGRKKEYNQLINLG